jgi:hypothetical protein
MSTKNIELNCDLKKNISMTTWNGLEMPLTNIADWDSCSFELIAVHPVIAYSEVQELIELHAG